MPQAIDPTLMSERVQRHIALYHGAEAVQLIASLKRAFLNLPEKQTAHQLAKRAERVLRRYAKGVGMDPDIEVGLFQEREGTWRVGWEAGPFEWAIPASFAIIDACGRLCEPHYSFDLTFYDGE